VPHFANPIIIKFGKQTLVPFPEPVPAKKHCKGRGEITECDFRIGLLLKRKKKGKHIAKRIITIVKGFIKKIHNSNKIGDQNSSTAAPQKHTCVVDRTCAND